MSGKETRKPGDINLQLQIPPASAAVNSFDQRLPHGVDLIEVVHLRTQIQTSSSCFCWDGWPMEEASTLTSSVRSPLSWRRDDQFLASPWKEDSASSSGTVRWPRPDSRVTWNTCVVKRTQEATRAGWRSKESFKQASSSFDKHLPPLNSKCDVWRLRTSMLKICVEP